MKQTTILDLCEQILENNIKVYKLKKENDTIRKTIIEYVDVGRKLNLCNGKVECR